MDDLLKNKEVRRKINGLSPPVKRTFIESLLDLYEQETEEMIDVIEESRMELRGNYLSFEEESKFLRAESRLLEDKRQGTKKEIEQPNVRVNGITLRNSKYRSLSHVDEQVNSRTVKDPIHKRGKREIPLSEMIARSQSTDMREKRRPESVITSRSLPTPISLRTVEEEKEEVMKNLSIANRQKEIERKRQTETIAQRREMKLQQKLATEEKALLLLQKAVAMDNKMAEKRREQDQKLKERLEDIKRKQTESRIGSCESVDNSIQENYKSKKIDVKQITTASQKQSRNEAFEMINTNLMSAPKIKADKPNGAGMEHKYEKDKNEKIAADYDFTIY